MAREVIIEKLTNELQVEITTERQVVYILVEIRKYLEREKLKDQYKALNFFCSWAVHARLKGEGGQRILRRFDDLHEQLLAHDLDFEKLPQEFRNEIGRTMNLSKFHDDLLGFLSREDVDLPTAWVSDKVKWFQFVNLYSEIIEDCPLVLAEDNVSELKYVRDITVRKIRPLPDIQTRDDQIVVFATSWEMTFKNTDDRGELILFFSIPSEELSSSPV